MPAFAGMTREDQLESVSGAGFVVAGRALAYTLGMACGILGLGGSITTLRRLGQSTDISHRGLTQNVAGLRYHCRQEGDGPGNFRLSEP